MSVHLLVCDLCDSFKSVFIIESMKTEEWIVICLFVFSTGPMLNKYLLKGKMGKNKENDFFLLQGIKK